MKNIARFFKHPAAMVFWRITKNMTPKHTFALTLTSFMFIGFLQWQSISDSKQDVIKYLVRSGHNPQGDGTAQAGLYDSQALIPVTFYHQLAYSYALASNVYPSNANNQAYRKHFDLRRAYGINKAA